MTEVEVDGFTDVARAAGRHPARRRRLAAHIDRGQIEGAFVQGMGWLTGEELRWDESDGRTAGPAHPLGEHVPAPELSATPAEFNVRLLGTPPSTAWSTGKAVGEPPLMLAISVREALRDAVAAFGPGVTRRVRVAGHARGGVLGDPEARRAGAAAARASGETNESDAATARAASHPLVASDT